MTTQLQSQKLQNGFMTNNTKLFWTWRAGAPTLVEDGLPLETIVTTGQPDGVGFWTRTASFSHES